MWEMVEMTEVKNHGYSFINRRHCVVAGLNLAVKAFVKKCPPRQLWLYEDKYWLGFENGKAVHPGEYFAITLPLIDTTDDQAVDQAIAQGIDFDGTPIPTAKLELYQAVMALEGQRQRSGVSNTMRSRIIRIGAKHLTQDDLNKKFFGAFVKNITGYTNF
jgi:hypothetical protein